MDNFTYENQGANTYLVYKMAESETLDSISLGMITNNRIPGFAVTMFMQMNNERYIKYNVTSKVSINQLFAGQINRKRLLGSFCGIVNALLAAEDYMIDADAILLDLDYIYADVSTCETVLICLPIKEKVRDNIDYDMFFRNIMFSTQFDQTENCSYVMQIINFLNSGNTFSLSQFKALLESLRDDGIRKENVSNTLKELNGDVQYTKQPYSPTADCGHPEKLLKQTDVHLPENYAIKNFSAQISAEDKVESSEKPVGRFHFFQHHKKESESHKAQKEISKKEQKTDKRLKKESKKSLKKGNIESGKKEDKNVPFMAFPIPGQDGGVIDASQSAQVKEAASISRNTGETAVPFSSHGSDDRVQQTFSDVKVSQIPEGKSEIAEKKVNEAEGFGDTVYANNLYESDDTVIMGQGISGQKIAPHLIRLRNNEKIPITKTIFRLGRNVEYNDYVISGNEFVGKSHCQIVTKNDEYFIIDNNSVNHTYVNGVIVQPGNEVKLAHGQSIRLANEEFEFRIF